MPNISDMMPSKYLKKEDVSSPVLVTIKGVSQANVGMAGQPEEIKWILHFRELDKPMVLNPTNINLAAMATDSMNTDDWTGKKVVLYNDPSISFQGKLTGGIRIRKPKNQPQPAKYIPPARVIPNPDADEVAENAGIEDMENDIPF